MMDLSNIVVRSNILFLPGIKRDDYVTPEQQLQKQALDYIDIMPPMQVTYDTIPRVFKGVKDWPKHTNLRCWWCTLQFQNSPLFLPERCYNVGEILCMDVIGVFNSFPCIIAYMNMLYKSDQPRRIQATDSIKRLYRIFTGKILSRMEQAPDKSKMNMYGGLLSQDEYLIELRKIEQKIEAAFIQTDVEVRQPFTLSGTYVH